MRLDCDPNLIKIFFNKIQSLSFGQSAVFVLGLCEVLENQGGMGKNLVSLSLCLQLGDPISPRRLIFCRQLGDSMSPGRLIFSQQRPFRMHLSTKLYQLQRVP